MTSAKTGPSAENERLLGLLTPIAKRLLTEIGLESAKDAIQVFGGHGFIQDSGVEQIYRTAALQRCMRDNWHSSLDLLGRKVLADQGVALRIMTKRSMCSAPPDGSNRPVIGSANDGISVVDLTLIVG